MNEEFDFRDQAITRAMTALKTIWIGSALRHAGMDNDRPLSKSEMQLIAESAFKYISKCVEKQKGA